MRILACVYLTNQTWIVARFVARIVARIAQQIANPMKTPEKTVLCALTGVGCISIMRPRIEASRKRCS